MDDRYFARSLEVVMVVLMAIFVFFGGFAFALERVGFALSMIVGAIIAGFCAQFCDVLGRKEKNKR